MIKTKNIMMVVLAVLLFSAPLFGETADHSKLVIAGTDGLRIYMPREITIDAEVIDLAAIGIIRGDEKLIAKVTGTSLGRFTSVGQEIVIDRNTILSRLASQGIKSSKVKLSGSEQTIVKRNEQIVRSKDFVEVATFFVKSQPEVASADSIKLIKEPKDWIMADNSGSVKLVPRKSGYSNKAWNKVWVAIVKDGVEIGGYELVFNVKFNKRRVVSRIDIEKGAVITPDNTITETILDNKAQPVNWLPPYGQVASRWIRKGSVISGNMTGVVESPKSIKRNQLVVIKIETAMLSISNIGQAQSDAAAGEFVKVKIGEGRETRIVIGKVKPDGTVEPVF
jgi:flagella basal body P-ring formation protein FlgA